MTISLKTWWQAGSLNGASMQAAVPRSISDAAVYDMVLNEAQIVSGGPTKVMDHSGNPYFEAFVSGARDSTLIYQTEPSP